jgi:cyclic beta-1,2-glucan synthetase
VAKQGTRLREGTLVGYFAIREEARRALRELGKRGFRRAALIYKGANGDIRKWDPFLQRRALWVVLSAVVAAGLAGIASTSLDWPGAMLARSLSSLVPVMAGGLLGAVLAAVWMGRSKHGLARSLVEDHARWLVSEETALVLELSVEALQLPVAVLRESGEIPPAIFVLHPQSESPTGDASVPMAPLSTAQIQEYVPHLARKHRVDPNAERTTELLKRLERSRQWIHTVCLNLAEAGRTGQSLPPTAEWLLDNEYIIESNIREVQLNLPRRFYQELPVLSDEPYRGLPRIYGLAMELVFHTDLRLDRENILAFVEAYQAAGQLSIGELWAVPQILRIALIESVQNLATRALAELRERGNADFWANRLITANRRDPNQLFAFLAELATAQPSPSPYFASQLINHLYDEEAASGPVRSWLERTLRKSLGDLDLREQTRQTKDQISIGNAFTSLRQLALLDWRKIFEELSRVERVLRLDPAGIYPKMDFETRDQYRCAVEELARGSGEPEVGVAQRAVELAAQVGWEGARGLAGHATGDGTGEGSREGTAEGPRNASKSEVPGEEPGAHVGTYLVGGARPDLARLLHCRETLRRRALQWVYHHHSRVYFIGLGLSLALLVSLVVLLGLRGQTPGVRLLIGLFLVVPASQLSLEVLNYLATRLLPPRTLPKMDFETSGIPDACRTLVVVPMLLVDSETIRAEVEKLEIRYLANKEENLVFGLFTDHTDSTRAHCDEDAPLLRLATESLETLNNRYGGEGDECFFLFHRERRWSESERKFIGWERKRGKLEELNRLIDGTRPDDAGRLVYVGDPDRLSNVRFVITLDSDTQLPHDAARRMVETLAHPLNRPRLDGKGRVLAGTYTVIQPRVSPSLPSTSGSPFSRLFSDAVGIDPYTKAVSDINQDLTGEGSYYGKGIYDVRSFNRVLSGTFPEEYLLSHDLIEGAHVRVGLASDIELYDEFPQDYLSYTSRQHRWIRGDWQIAEWILPRVPRSGGRRGPNPISWFDRWKILDNLRRSLVPAASLSLLVASWLVSSRMAWLSFIVVGVQIIFTPLVEPFTWATTRRGLKSFSFSKAGHDLARAIVDASLLPHQAWLALDAILRVGYRRLVSHRNLLEWTSAEVAQWNSPSHVRMFVSLLGLAGVLSAAMAWAVERWRPSSLLAAAPWLALWLVSPLIGWLLTRRPEPRQQQLEVTGRDLWFLRRVARRTWGYFSDFVGDKTSYLPPDNYQVSHRNQLAMRTSPTNIGLWIVSALGAHDFGYLTVDDVIDKLTHTLKAVGKLERYEGHLLNWYDIETLTPLEPRYVSTVDSGNLLGALLCLEHGLEELIRVPILDLRAFEGLRDAAEILREVADTDGGGGKGGRANRKGVAGLDTRLLDDLVRTLEVPPDRIADALRVLRCLEGRVKTLAEQVRMSVASARAGEATNVREGEATDARPRAAHWVGEISSQVSAWTALADRYLTWIEILAEKTEQEIAQLGAEAVGAWRQGLERAPSLLDLANGQVACIQVLQSIRDAAPRATGPMFEYLDRLIAAFEESRWLAGEMQALGEQLVQDGRDLAESVNMRFLYDSLRRLFSVGYNVSEGRRDSAYYDLFASEARLGSFVAIARGDVPVEHWFSMSRPYGAVGRRRVLLSWTGTMFEYLMPLVFQHSYDYSLLDKATREAVAIQVAYGRKHRVPWGISESAYGDLDLNKTYQYKAFGVPDLGLKRGLEEELVVAPYATMLAVGLAPRETVRNLKRLAELGLLDDYGYYEAMDFSRQPGHEGEHGVIVRAYMAHHQGMSFLSLANFVHGNSIQRRFHADPRVRAVEPLLLERIPVLPTLHHISTRDRVPSVRSVGEVAPSVSKFDTPHTSAPKTQMLSNGRYSLMVTNTGGGYSRWGEHEITRWRSDRTEDRWGTFCYIHEADSDRVWSNAYHPVGGKAESYSASFVLDRAVFRRVDDGIHCDTEVVVSPEDDVEIRRITLVNRSIRTRRLELTSYVELSMAPHGADLQHPAFNKLFIATEAVNGERALLAHRRTHSEADSPIYVAHRLTLEGAEAEPFEFETDRRRFIGRGRTLANPMGIFQKLTNSQGFVLDPILSMRQSVTLHPTRRVQVTLILAAGETREQVMRLVGKYGDAHAVHRAMDFAWASAHLELRLLRIQPDEARRFQHLASYLLYPNPLMRSTAECIEENRKGRAGLWPYGISGDLPIALVTIGEARDIALVRQMLQAHTYWRKHGLVADLVILNEEPGGYEQPLRERLEGLIRTHSMHTGIDKPGGVYLRSADLIPEEDQALLKAAASLVLVSARGTFPQQLSVPLGPPDLPEPLAKKRTRREPSPVLPFLELPYFNSLGGFTSDGREYVIYLGPDISTPAPWVNVIANPTFGTLVSETGAGFTWYGNSQRNRLTQWSNDPVVDPPSEALYVRDEETGTYWTPTPSPVREETAYRTRHGAGYTVFEHNSNGLEQVLTVFVPVDEKGGDPIKLQKLRLRNDSSRPRKLSVTYYVEWTLGENREASQMHIMTSWDDEVQAVLARNSDNPEYGDRMAFAALTAPVESYTGDRTSFLGRNRSSANPATMERARLSRRMGVSLDPCAALQATLELAPGETAEITCMLGQAGSVQEVHKLVETYRGDLAFDEALGLTKAWWDDLLGTIQVHTPELAADFLINRWLLYQSLSCRIWGRSAFYQSGGAFGFRDQLQDVMALLGIRPELAREHIIMAASRQFREGDVQHWWHPPSGAGLRSRISDDLLWLPYVVAQYVRVTGDCDILREEVPFLDSPRLKDDENEIFSTPNVALERTTLFGHCRRAVTRSLTFGPHGLPLMGTGDWNDGMNLVGALGKGESVWLAWFLADVLDGMGEMADLVGQSGLGQTYRKERKALLQRVERSAWDGKWYLRAIFDDGTPLGSSNNEEAQIDSLPQSWAWLGGGAGKDGARNDRAAEALESVWSQLVREDEGLVLLLAPPFSRSEPSPGYIQAYPPGVRENGGQYTHAAVWFAMALARRGAGGRAVSILRMLNPIERARDSDSVWRYGIEPYVAAADVYRLPGRIGHGGWSWYTGAASWMYQAWVGEILGLKVRGDHLEIDPVIPASWEGFSLRYRHGEAVYEIRVENRDGCERGVAWAEIDGKRVPDGVIPLERGLVKHRVLVHMGNP